MAITKKITTAHGIELVNAYIRVEAIRFIEKNKIAFNACIYADPAKQSVDQLPLSCQYYIDAGNPFEQAYDYMKLLPEFAEAVDC